MDDLRRLGDALERSVTADAARGSRSRPRRTRRLVTGFAVALIAVPGVAFAASSLISTKEVADSMPAGTLALMGTDPSCEVIREGIEFECTLANPPGEGDIERGGWMDAAEPTVDAQKRVNGGCRSQDPDGMKWRCYIGEEAVKQKIIGRGFLGEYAPHPGVG